MSKTTNYKSQRKSKGGLIHIYGQCEVCGMTFDAKNGVGLAAQHTDRTGHQTRVETGYSVSFYVGEYKGASDAETQD